MILLMGMRTTLFNSQHTRLMIYIQYHLCLVSLLHGNIVLHYFCKIAFKTKSIISTGLHKVQHLIYFYLHSFLTFNADPDKHSISAISLTLDALTFYICILLYGSNTIIHNKLL